MKNNLKQAVVFCLSAGLIMGSLSGCAKKKDSFDTAAAAIKVNDSEISAGVLNFAVRYNQASMESLYMSLGATDPFDQDLFGSGETLGQQVKEQLTSDLTHSVLAEQHMEEYGVSLSDDDKKQISDTAAKFMSDNDANLMEQLHITQADVERYLELNLIERKMEPVMSADVDTEVSDEEAAQRKIQYVLFTPVTEEDLAAEAETETEAAETEAAETEAVTEAVAVAETEAAETEAVTEAVAAVETEAVTEAATETETETAALESSASNKTTSAEETEAATEAATEVAEAETEAVEAETEDPEAAAASARAYAQAEEMLAQVKAGGDFTEVAEAMGKTVTDRTFGADYSVTALVEATEGLPDGTLVEEPVAASAGGYYVIYLETQLDREATDAEKENIVEQRKKDAIQALYTEWGEAGEVTVDEAVVSTIKFDYHLAQPVAEEDEIETEIVEIETEISTEIETE